MEGRDDQKSVSLEEAQRRINKANETFPDALVTGYELLVHQLQLPDKKRSARVGRSHPG